MWFKKNKKIEEVKVDKESELIFKIGDWCVASLIVDFREYEHTDFNSYYNGFGIINVPYTRKGIRPIYEAIEGVITNVAENALEIANKWYIIGKEIGCIEKANIVINKNNEIN